VVRRLFLAYVALLILALAIFGIVAARTTRSRVLDEISRRLDGEAETIAELVRKDPSPEALRSFLKSLGLRTEVRLTVIAPDGTVVADSHADVAAMENHNNRPEVREARATGKGLNVRFSDTVRFEMMYLALLLDPARRDGTVIRAALPLTRVEEEVGDLNRGIAIAFVLVGLAGGGVTIVVSRWITGPLRGIRTVAQAIAAGDFTRRAPLAASDEIGSVSAAINRMSEELERRLERLKAEGAKLEAALSSLQDGVIALDEGGRILHLNAAASSLLSLAPGSEGLLFWEAVRAPGLETRANVALRQGAVVEHSLDVGGRTLSLSFSPLRGSSGCVLVVRDVTEERRYDRLRKEFVANVSHELRTPLSVIRGYVETLRDGALKDAENAPRFLESIEKNVERLSSLVGDLLELSRLESGTQLLHPRTLEGRELVQKVIEDFRPLAEKRKQTLSVEAREAVPFQADPDLLERALRNLVENAIKYTGEGGSIRVLVGSDEDEVVFTVQDTGMGIPEADLPRVFERFYRVDKSRSRELGGTGLGLAIVKHVAQLHGGSVSVQSRVGHGSSFRLRLPRTPSP
jgi:two-component system phosphate regulon sensor histidine kinase PhoR